MEDIILQIWARRERALEDSDANLAALLFNVLGLIDELQLDVQKWQISVNQGNEIIKEIREQLRRYEHETETVKECKEKLQIAKEALAFYTSAWERGDFEGELLVRKISTNDAFENVHDRAKEALEKIK